MLNLVSLGKIPLSMEKEGIKKRIIALGFMETSNEQEQEFTPTEKQLKEVQVAKKLIEDKKLK